MSKRFVILGLALMFVLGGGLAAQEYDMQAAMEAMEKAAMVNEQHEWLAEMTGHFDVEMKMWMQPGTDPMILKGKSERHMMLDGRVLAERYTSDFMGQKFEGFGMTGYDNAKGEYWATWNDTMSTFIMIMKGECNDRGDMCTFRGTMDDPLSGASMAMKMINHYHEDGSEVIESFMTMPDGSEMKNMELTYTPAD